MDKKSIIKKLLLGPADWITLTPFLLVVTAAFGIWAFSMESGPAAVASIILILLSGGIYLQRLFFGWNENYEKLANEARESIEKSRNDALDALYLELKKNGVPSLVQDEATSVVWGMPGSAVRAKCADDILPLDKIAPKIVAMVMG